MNIMGAATTARSTGCSTRPPTRPGSSPGCALLQSSACASTSVRRSTALEHEQGARSRARTRPATGAAAGAGSRPTGSWWRCPSSAPASSCRRSCSGADPSARAGSASSRPTGWPGSSSTCAIRSTSPTGHVTFVDAPWALTALTQAQFWDERDFPPTTATACGRLPLGGHLRLGHAGDPLQEAGQALHAQADQARGVGQIKAHLEDNGESVLLDTVLSTRGSWTPGSGGSEKGRATATQTPLLVNTVGSWDNRPEAEDGAPQPVPVPATTCAPTSTWRRWREPTRPAARRPTRCSTPPGRRRSRRRCTSSTTRRRSRPRRPPTAELYRRAGRTCSTRA